MKNKSFNIANMPKYGYAVDLSKSNSVTPQRHCGFIVPTFCLASQAVRNSKRKHLSHANKAGHL